MFFSILSFACETGFEIFDEVAATAVWWCPFYVTTTTVVKFPSGKWGYIVIQAIPLGIYIDENAENGDIVYRQGLEFRDDHELRESQD